MLKPDHGRNHSAATRDCPFENARLRGSGGTHRPAVFLGLGERWVNVQTLADNSDSTTYRRLVSNVLTCDGEEISPVLDVDIEQAEKVVNLGLVVN